MDRASDQRVLTQRNEYLLPGDDDRRFLWYATVPGVAGLRLSEWRREDRGRWPVVGHGAKLSRKKDEAIAALLTQPTVATAALAAKISPQTLGRWMKEPEFEAVWRKALGAVLGQAIARLQKASGAAVTILLRIMNDPGAPVAARLKAVEVVLRHAKAANEMEAIQPRLSDLERAPQPVKVEIGRRTGGEREGAPIAGHGAKFSRKMDEAIAALLTQRSVEEAAQEAKIGTQTLYRWIRQPEFDAAWREARRAAFGTGQPAPAAGIEHGGHDAAEYHGPSRHTGGHQSEGCRSRSHLREECHGGGCRGAPCGIGICRRSSSGSPRWRQTRHRRDCAGPPEGGGVRQAFYRKLEQLERSHAARQVEAQRTRLPALR